MFQIHTEVTDKLISDVCANVKGKRFSRALWLDIEPIATFQDADGNESFSFSFSKDVGPTAFALVLRGQDDVTADAPDSSARDGEDRAEHNRAVEKASTTGIFWTTPTWIASETIKRGGYWQPNAFTLASFDDQATADQVCAELLAFYSDAVASDDSPALPFSERVGGLTAPAREILPILLAVFGSAPNSVMLGSGHLGTFADYLANRTKKAKPAPKRKSEDQIKAEAQAELMARITAQLANQPGSNQAQLMAIIAQLQMPATAK